MLAGVMQRTLVSLTLTIAGALAGAASAQTPLTVRGVPDGAPFRVRAVATDRELAVTLDLDPEWHAYSRDTGGGRPVALTIDASSDFAIGGPLAVVDANAEKVDNEGKLEGEARLLLPLERHGEGFELSATLALQVCDALECLAPMKLAISGEVAPLRVLLVVAVEDERAERIRAWLAARGFATHVTTYATVDLATADTYDVVVADSDVFQKHGVRGDVIARFPRTATPIVAVGFIGTQLCESHGLAMTSGYI
jgi:hypothetical protein